MSTAAPPPRRFELGLLGFPVSHSASPAMHRAALAAAGLDGDYALWEVPDAEGLEAYFVRLRTGQLAGANVTIPWKTEAATRCDVLVGDALTIGAANTIAGTPEGLIVGHNTDVAGLVTSVRESFQEKSFCGAVVTVVGAGGAARSAILAADKLGAGEIRVYNRTAARAHEVSAALGLGVVVADLPDALNGTQLVLQASSLGLNCTQVESQALADSLVNALSGLAPGAVLYDLVYKPSPTAWMLAARRLGFQAVDGLGMLVHQAAHAFAIWTGHEVDPQVMLTAAKAHLAPAGG